MWQYNQFNTGPAHMLRQVAAGSAWMLGIQGAALVALGLLILLVPHLLETLVATAIILVGAGFLAAAYRARAWSRRFMATPPRDHWHV